MEFPSLLDTSQIVALLNALQGANRIVLTAHRGPDGDAVGAALALSSYLRQIGKSVNIVLPNACPDFLRWMPGCKDIVFAENDEANARNMVKDADLIFLLDYNSLGRLGEMSKMVESAKAKRVMIDHHLSPDTSAAQIVISQPEASSTCELVFRVVNDLGGFEKMTRSAAACIYTGMMTDTGNFSYASSRPEIYMIISMLLTKGIDKDRIYRNVFHNYSEHRLRFVGYVLNEKLSFYQQRKASILNITREEMQRYKYIRGDSEGLVNMPLQVRGMRLSISLREDTERDVIRVSLRSVDDFPCNKMAEEFFNGGGHLNASGGELPFPLSEAIRTAERAIEAYADLL